MEINNMDDFGDNFSDDKVPVQELTGSDKELATPSRGTTDVSQWAKQSSTNYYPTFNTTAVLPAGLYDICFDSNEQMYFEQKPIHVDQLIEFPDSMLDSIIKEIDSFWNKSELFLHYGFLHRRGYLFYGVAGGGKTCLVQLIIKNIIHDSGIILLGKYPPHIINALKVLRKIEPLRKVVCLFEDIDAIIQRYGDSELLSLLDGEDQSNYVLNIATTNYPEKLDKRIISRPRRFDRVIKILSPTKDMRRIYFREKLKIEDSELDVFVSLTEGFTFAGCAEMVISVKCFDMSIEEAAALIGKLMTTKHSSEDDMNKIGIQ